MFVTPHQIIVNKPSGGFTPGSPPQPSPRLFSPCSNMFSVLLNKVEIIHEKRINKGPFQSWVMYAGMHPMLSPNASTAAAAAAPRSQEHYRKHSNTLSSLQQSLIVTSQE